jgi:protein TonB
VDPFFPESNPAAKRRRVAPLVVGGVLGVALLGMAISALFTNTDVGKHKTVTQISLIPPPPPPKPPEEKPPEPPKPREEVKLDPPKPVDEPKPAPEQPPAGPIGLDATGTGPGDGFGLAGRPGGRDITVGGGGGGGGMGLSLFGSSTARHIAQELARDPKLRATQYKIEIRIWLTQDGRIEREEIVRGTGDRDLDAQIRTDLSQIGAIPIPVPQNLPQPLRIRVTSSDA